VSLIQPPFKAFLPSQRNLKWDFTVCCPLKFIVCVTAWIFSHDSGWTSCHSIWWAWRRQGKHTSQPSQPEQGATLSSSSARSGERGVSQTSRSRSCNTEFCGEWITVSSIVFVSCLSCSEIVPVSLDNLKLLVNLLQTLPKVIFLSKIFLLKFFPTGLPWNPLLLHLQLRLHHNLWNHQLQRWPRWAFRKSLQFTRQGAVASSEYHNLTSACNCMQGFYRFSGADTKQCLGYWHHFR
jgi:hypothetical protein